MSSSGKCHRARSSTCRRIGRVTPLLHDAGMATRHRNSRTEAPEQLSLSIDSSLPIQFRLDRRTRERGLAHIAEIRRQLAERQGLAPTWVLDQAA